MKKLLLSLALISVANLFAGVSKDTKAPYSGCSADPGFELWNNTSSPIYYSYVKGGGDPLQKGFTELKPNEKDCANTGKSNKAKLAIATRKPQFNDIIYIYTVTDNRNVYAKVITDKGRPKVVPQDSKYFGAQTEISGYPFKGNISVNDLPEKTELYTRATPSDIEKSAKELLVETAKPTATVGQIEALLARGAKMNINIQDDRTKNTPIMNAIKNSNLDVFKLLLKNNAKLDLKNIDNESAFQLAILQLCENKRSPKAQEILKILFEAGAK
ncbi:ankyrin repeat domain-containing protein [Candidatus Dependentiae bacterium]|nr:ankyrin repeat domain-containing protein [Candidatus Dependentiae bacterium]